MARWIKGVDEPLPEEERILWQGGPTVTGLALHAFHIRKLALYFAVMLAWWLMVTLRAGEPWALDLAKLGGAALAVLAAGWLAAWLAARSTEYTITSRRLIMRIGIAFSISLNLPFGSIAAAGLRLHGDGTGDIAITLQGKGRIAWLHLWPHARPWRLAHPQPMLRSVPDAANAASILVGALGGTMPAPAPAESPSRAQPVPAAA